MYDDDYKFLYQYPINYSNINRRLRKIICNNEICHAITENGLVFSWGNDIYHRGTLGLGKNIFQVNSPVLNKYLSKTRIFDISLSEEHCTAIDENNYLYTWGVEEHGELGYFDQNEKNICEPIRVNMDKKPFLVNRVKCGKYYTAGINNKGIPFIFGNKKKDNNNEIIFFSFDNKVNFDLIAKDIYCGEDYLIIHLENEKLLIYSFNNGLFELKLFNNESNNNYIISKINIINKNFYLLDEKNNRLFEFIYDNRNFNKIFNIYDFYQNEYEVNHNIKLSIIEMPFFVKFLFFWIECSENEKKEFISQKTKMFNKLNGKNLQNISKNGPKINEYILFGNNKKKIELIKVEFVNLYNKKEKHFTLNGDCIYSNYKKNIIEKNIYSNLNTINNNNELSFQSLNIPISSNYGNKNDAYDYNKCKLNFDFQLSNEMNNNIDYNKSNKKAVKYNYSYDKKKKKINRVIYEKEREDENIFKMNNNLITLDNNDIKNNISIISNKNNSFLLKKPSNFSNNDNIKENNDKNNYIYIPMKNSKKRGSSINKDENSNNANDINSANVNTNKSEKEDNEFDNILKNINKRKLMLNQPVKNEINNISTKKCISQMKKTKSKTEMLINELQETFFGKVNINLTNKNRRNMNLDTEKEKKENKESNLFIKIREIDENKKYLKKEKEEKFKKEKAEKIKSEEKERIKKIEKLKTKVEKEEIKKENESLMKEKEKKEKERIEKERKEKEEMEKERILKEKERIERDKKESLIKLKERIEKEKKEKEEKEKLRKEKERIEKEKNEKERIDKELKEKEEKEKEKLEKEELDRLNQLLLEKEELEKKIEDIKEKKHLKKEKLEKDLIEKEKIESENIRRKEELMEKNIREKLEKEYKGKYEKEKLEKEEEPKRDKEKIEKQNNEEINVQKRIATEKIKELGKKEEIVEKKEKEKEVVEEKRKRLLITSEINNFIEGNKANIKKDNNFQENKFLPERLKTENENNFIMKGLSKKNYNYTISENQQLYIENHQLNCNNKNNNLNINDNSKKNISDIIYISSNNELNINIEDIFSSRDTISDNNINKIESFEIDNKNYVQDLPLKLIDNNKNEIKENKQSNNILNNTNNTNIKQEEQTLFQIEDNNKSEDFCNNKDKVNCLEMAHLSNKKNEKQKKNDLNLNITKEENDEKAPETMPELEESKKKFNFNWKEKTKNRISEIIEEKQELEMIQSIDDNLQTNSNKNEFNVELPLPYNNDSEQPIVPVSEISTNNMRHISTFDQNIISSTRKLEPKELEDITGSLRFFSNRSANNNLFSIFNNKNKNNKPISQRNNNNNLNINSNVNSSNNSNMKPYYGVWEKNKNDEETNIIKNEGYLNESNKDANPNDNIEDQKMIIDELEQSKFPKESNIFEKICYNTNKINNAINEENEKKIKLNKIIKLKSKEELKNIINELKKIEEKNNNKDLDESLYFLLENDMNESNSQNSNGGGGSKIIKIKNNKMTKYDSESNPPERNSFIKGLFFNYNSNNINKNNFENNVITDMNNFNTFNNMNNTSNFNNIIINNDNNYNNINYINDISNDIKNSFLNYHSFKEIKNTNKNKYPTENKYERGKYIVKNNINIFDNNKDEFSHYNERDNSMTRIVKIKSISKKTKSRGKERHKTEKKKKKTGIIEQIKKEQNEKKNNIMYNTFNQRNVNILPIKNETQPYSKNSIAKIDYINMNIYQCEPHSNKRIIQLSDKKKNSNFVLHNKSKNVNINKCLSTSPKKRFDDFSKYDLETKEKNSFYNYDNNNINNNNFIINKNNIEQEQEKKSFILLRQKYLEFLIKVYGNNDNLPKSKETEELDNDFLKGLAKNEIPIENISLNLLKCSNDMKEFIRESLENFRLQQLKEKIFEINENKIKNTYLNDNTEKNLDKNNNINGLIQLDYEDEIKDKNNILEPIELDKSNYNLNFRKSFIDSLSGIRNNKSFYNSEITLQK